ncbi:MAG: Ig-like domain repeat protein [Bacteroidaceae bacterium]|nr:Ig-like domain repeat protein [Bacteroidaceae bacterium]
MYTEGSTAVNITGGKSHTFNNSVSGAQYFCISLGNSNNGQVLGVTVTYEEGGVDPSKTPTTTTFNGESSYNVVLGDEFNAPTATVSPEGLDDPTYSSSNTAVATVDATTGSVTLVGAGVTTITASYAGDDTYASSFDSYTLTVTKPIPVFTSLEELAADDNLVSGDIVNVSFQNVEIKSVYVSSGQKRQGIYFDIQKGDKDIEIYYSAEEVPETWVAGGTVSGTMQCPWKNYNGTWELAPDYGKWSWDNLEYVAPSGQKTVATINFTGISNLEVGANANIEVEYNGDGVLEVLSSNPSVAQVSIEGTQVSIVTVAAGTTTITVSADETENYTDASKQFTLTVTEPAQPFDRNVHKALVAEKDGKYFAAYNTISGTNKYFVVKEVTVYNNKVYGLSDDDAAEIAWRVDVNGTDATVRNLENKFLTLATTTTASLSSTEVVLYAGEDGGYYYSETGRGFAYNPSAPRMASYTVNNTYSAAKAMEFAAENEPLPANIRISAAGWATFCAPFAVEIPEGVTAYRGTMKQGWIQLNELTDGYIPGGIGTVITGSERQEYLEPMNPQPNSGSLMSCFLPNLTGAIMDVAVGNYLLQIQNDVVGWYKVEGEGFKLAPNRCYLSKDDVPAPNQSRTFFGFAPDDVTGISSIATEAKTKADGKYMVNGQIVVVKAGKAYNMNGTEVK